MTDGRELEGVSLILCVKDSSAIGAKWFEGWRVSVSLAALKYMSYVSGVLVKLRTLGILVWLEFLLCLVYSTLNIGNSSLPPWLMADGATFLNI